MNINRHNYEEFFLLYVDNELTAAQRKIVDAFVAVNPDLQREFQQFQQTIFTTDKKLDYDFISSLLKPVDEETSISEEQLLLYVDDELKADERILVEKAIAENAGLQKELQWLQRTTQEADSSIVFPDKSLLYKEAEPARVFYMSSVARRWAAAAAVILLLGSAMWLVLSKPTDATDQLTSTPSVGTEEKQPVTTVIKTPEEQPQQIALLQPAGEKQNIILTKEKNNNKHSVNKQEGTIAKTDKEKNQQQPIIIPTQENNGIVKVEPPVNVNPEKNSDNLSNKTETPTVQPKTSTANTTTYASYNNDTNNEDEQLLFNEDRQRKSGLTGFVKKAKRMFERNTGIQSNGSEVRFAVFAVNTQ